MVITGKEKAFIGGLGAGITAFAGQLSATNGKLDTKTLICSLGAWLFTHLFVYYTTNTPVTEQTLVDDAASLGAAVAAAEKPVNQPEVPAAPAAPVAPAAPATPPAAPITYS